MHDINNNNGANALGATTTEVQMHLGLGTWAAVAIDGAADAREQALVRGGCRRGLRPRAQVRREALQASECMYVVCGCHARAIRSRAVPRPLF